MQVFCWVGMGVGYVGEREGDKNILRGLDRGLVGVVIPEMGMCGRVMSELAFRLNAWVARFCEFPRTRLKDRSRVR